MTSKTEKALGAALRGESTKVEKSASRSPQIKVTLAVRRADGGQVFRFEHTSATISAIAAETDAKRLARESGLIVWAVIDVDRLEG